MPSRLGCLTLDGNGAYGLADPPEESLLSSDRHCRLDVSFVEHSDDSSANRSRRLSEVSADDSTSSVKFIRPSSGSGNRWSGSGNRWSESGNRWSESGNELSTPVSLVSSVVMAVPLPRHIRFNNSELARNISARLTSSYPSSSAIFSSCRQWSVLLSMTCIPSRSSLTTSLTHFSSALCSRSKFWSGSSAARSLQQSDAGSSQSSVDVEEDDDEDDTVRFSRTIVSETRINSTLIDVTQTIEIVNITRGKKRH